MSEIIASVTVFCGSRFGKKTSFRATAKEVGVLLGENKIRLVFGGGCVGLMGELANAALEQKGEVLGIIPEILIEKEIPHDKVTELIIVKDLHERKRLMEENADAFIVLPGGIGTMEEFFEIFTWQFLGIHSKPIFILNIDDIYTPMFTFLNHLVQNDFMEKNTLDRLIICTSVEELSLHLAYSHEPA